MIGILNYGLGNVDAFVNCYNLLGVEAVKLNDYESLPLNLTGVVIPGVGAFDDAIKRFYNLKISSDLLYRIREGLPTLGVCVGMQMLFDSSDEGKEKGLGIIPGKVVKFSNQHGLRYPHTGPNLVHWDKDNSICNGLDDAEFYFLHGYYCKPKLESDVIGFSYYGVRFPTAVNRDNVYGVQFHPEKSHFFGQTLLDNFACICESKRSKL